MTKELNIKNNQQLINRYIINFKIGQGSFGETYQATDQKDGKQVVLKILNYSELKEWKKLELFEREIEVLKSLDHPLIPNYYNNFNDKINDNDILVLVQEYVKGDNLFKSINNGKVFTLNNVKSILRNLLEILDYIHNLYPCIIHRDINPKNIILNDNGCIYLVDFGAVGHIVDNTTAALKSDTFVGTLGYMPPEQFYGKIFPSSDIYSLGTTILFILTGKEPSEFDVKKMKLDYHKNVEIPQKLKSLIDKMIEPDINKRIKSAKTSLDILNNVKISLVPVNKFWTPQFK